jgi:hypothetical protein
LGQLIIALSSDLELHEVYEFTAFLMDKIFTEFRIDIGTIGLSDSIPMRIFEEILLLPT